MKSILMLFCLVFIIFSCNRIESYNGIYLSKNGHKLEIKNNIATLDNYGTCQCEIKGNAIILSGILGVGASSTLEIINSKTLKVEDRILGEDEYYKK